MCSPHGRTYGARMKRFLPSTTAAALLAAALFVSATGGAVAGSMITGKQIKNGSVTGKDLKDESVSTADLAPSTLVAGPPGPAGAPGAAGQPGIAGVSGYQVVTATDTQVSNDAGLQADGICTGGRKPLGATASFSRRFNLAPVVQTLSDTTIRAFGINDNGGAETLTLTVYCASVG